MLIKAIHFRNFKVLRDATLPLGRVTVLVGANGSGKTTALQGIELLSRLNYAQLLPKSVSLNVPQQTQSQIEITAQWDSRERTSIKWVFRPTQVQVSHEGYHAKEDKEARLLRMRVFSLDAAAIAAPVQLAPEVDLDRHGGNLAGVLDRLRDNAPERFESLNGELHNWLPEFDRILFETPLTGRRAIQLRTTEGHHAIAAADLSQGTLLALTLLTLAYLPTPPTVVGLEEPDRGLHPRLLRHVQDAIYRLAYPENFGEKREPVQVIATTHSPYFLDLFKDHPEEIVIAEKKGLEARFQRLTERDDIEEILGDAPLGEVWFSGVLGGVPAES